MAFKRAHLSKQTRAWTKAGSVTAEAVVGMDEESPQAAPPSEYDYGVKPIWLKITTGKSANKPLWVHLTGMTVEELDAFKHVVDLAFADARKVNELLDESAFKVLQESDDLGHIPLRALASPPPTYEREVDVAYIMSDGAK
jgi:hypothetical protein